MKWLIDPESGSHAEPAGAGGCPLAAGIGTAPPPPPPSGGDPAAGTPEPADKGVSRRRFLRLLGAGVGTAAVAGAGFELLSYKAYAASTATSGMSGGSLSGRAAATMADTADPATHQWCMVIDLRYCDGCRSCTAACQKAHALTQEQTWIDVFTMTDSSGGTYHMPRPCMQCENPPCLDVCPVHATWRTDQGVVLVNQGRCIGCRMCMAACPYQARYFNWSSGVVYPTEPVQPTSAFPVPQREGTVGKCTFCVGNLNNGLLSECAAGCPMGVIYNGDLVTDVAVNSQGTTIKLSTFLRNNDAVTFKPQDNTHPRVWYILGHGQNLDSDVTSAQAS